MKGLKKNTKTGGQDSVFSNQDLKQASHEYTLYLEPTCRWLFRHVTHPHTQIFYMLLLFIRTSCNFYHGEVHMYTQFVYIWR
jgi:hypothetical protein